MTDRDILAAGMAKRAGLSRVLTGLPLIGGALHGLIDPVEGSPRGTSLFYEGAGGGLGSILGGIGGSLALEDEQGRPGAGGLLGGSALGGVVGSHLGRWLAESQEDPEVEQLRKLIAKLEREGAGGVVVNVGQAQHGGGPTAAAAMGEQTPQDGAKISSIEVELETDDQED